MGNEVSSNLPEDWATVDMVAQFAYCSRRFHLMYAEGRWADNAHTLEGKDVHRRVDRIDQILPETKAEADTANGNDGDAPPEIARSVSLGCDDLGLMGKLDLVSADPEGCEAVPVETKKSRVPPTPERTYPPERVQLMAQGLLLRAHGYRSDHGYVYYAGSRTRVRVEFTAELEEETRAIVQAVRDGRAATTMPQPLEDSPKCWGCSLCGICLPDETLALREGQDTTVATGMGRDVRRLFPARDRASPFYVQEQGARVGKSGERLTVSKNKETIGGARLIEVSQLVLIGNVQVSAQTLHLLMGEGIPTLHFSTGGWFHGISHGTEVENAYSRSAQYHTAADPVRCHAFALELVRAKAINQRVMLQRNARQDGGRSAVARIAEQLKLLETENYPGLDELRGWEGRAAALYFSAFQEMLKTGELPDFLFTHRNRRPPKDPVNALLSFAYAMLAKECVTALLGEGLDPWWGFYHQPRHGRPALALDLMEPFRPVIADSVVITAINTGMVSANDFISNANGCALQPGGRKAFLRAWEQRLDQLFTHPDFDYRCSWRTILRIQARLLARWLRGDIPKWSCPVVR